MKSGKQRREEIKAKRLERLARHVAASTTSIRLNTSFGAVLSDITRLAPNNSYGVWPSLYLDRPFICRDCGSCELWTAKQQKWWYEIAQGSIYSSAVRCRPCRIVVRDRVDHVRRVSLEGMVRKLEQKKLKEEND
jgi:Probable zinc-ribbon domain